MNVDDHDDPILADRARSITDPDKSKLPAGQPSAAPESCPAPTVSRAHELIGNLPYVVMILLGSAIMATGLAGTLWAWLATAGYFVYGVAGAFWVMLFICPHCHFYDTRLCPCGYGWIAARLRPRQADDRFAAQFRKHIPVIVPLWFVPLVAGVIPLLRGFSWLLLALLLVFAIEAFLVLPLVSRKYGCRTCPQKATCPWMGGCKGT
jgi:hypothetical protein